jgi:hypothetical protein
MAAEVLWKFDSDKFWKDMRGRTLITKLNNEVFSEVPDLWSGRADVEPIPNGLKFVTGPDQSTLIGVKVTVDPEESDLNFEFGSTDSTYYSRSYRGKRNPWNSQHLMDAITDVMYDYIVKDEEATAKKRARSIRSLAETSKGFEFGTKGRSLPESVQSNIASFLTGSKPSAGTPMEQMRKLRDKIDPNYAEKLEERRTQETLAAMKGGRRKSKRASKKRGTTRRQ